MTTQEIVHAGEQQAALARVSDELSVEDIVARVQKVHEVQRQVMKEGKHYGKIPGVDKPTLLKPGAEILGMVFRLDPQFETVEQLREPGGHLTVVIRCILFHIPTGTRLGSGMGSCSTHESKYAYRKGERVCPDCGKPAIIKSKFGNAGWVCFKKKDGCGATFNDNDDSIMSQTAGRVANEDVADSQNTVLKMAIKRAHVAAILFVTCASEIFTQDVEDQARDEPDVGGAANNQTRGKPPGGKCAEFLRSYASCADEEGFRKLEAPVRAAWKAFSKTEKEQLNAAISAAQQRLLDTMDQPYSGGTNDDAGASPADAKKAAGY